MHFADNIYNALNQNEPAKTLSVFIDLKKAFDTVDHKILLKKMEHYGFRGTSNIWFQNYLSEREQFVSINGAESSMQSIICGAQSLDLYSFYFSLMTYPMQLIF